MRRIILLVTVGAMVVVGTLLVVSVAWAQKHPTAMAHKHPTGIMHLMHGNVAVYSTYEASFSHSYRVFWRFGQPSSLRL
jgi:hypothetical protein